MMFLSFLRLGLKTNLILKYTTHSNDRTLLSLSNVSFVPFIIGIVYCTLNNAT